MSDLPQTGRNTSIQTKIVLTVLFGLGLSMLVTFINFISYDRHATLESLKAELQVLAAITAARSSAAMAFEDQSVAEENLHYLSLRNNIQAACIFRSDHSLFARFERNAALLACPESATEAHWSRTLDDAQWIHADEVIANISQQQGRIVVISDTSLLDARLKKWAGLGAVTVLITGLCFILMMVRLRSLVVAPLTRLTQVVDQVKRTNDLSLRAPVTDDDEIGQLIRSFNDMLNLIESSNVDLAIVYDELVTRSTEAEASAVELEAQYEEIKDFLSGAAHDLRQPLQAMAIFVDMLQQSSPDQRAALEEKLRSAMSNLQTMFTEILDISRLEHKRGMAEFHPVDLTALFNKLQLEFSVLAQAKQLDLRTHVPGLVVHSVPGILERLIRNLVSNAIRYTDQGGILISARTRRDAVWIEVWDTGRGIAPDNLEKIFGKFEQAEGGHHERGSYGLGLAIINNFIHLLGYDLQVRSELGRGSRFRIVLPSLSAQSAQHALDMHPGTAQVEGPRHNADYDAVMEQMLQTTVLLVDDDETLREALATALTGWGMNALAFASLDEVSEYFTSGDFIDPDVILTDYQLGDGVHGDEVIEEVRLLSGVHVPALMISGATEEGLAERMQARGYVFLAKPVDLPTLREAIHQLAE